ncbi:hypothetical protein DFQ09_102302 [Winogradskyella pacifica]|uniref:PH (Pleckstrin Homology) domain-containing protein n=1 Tax=Winogradskyella pacifica TaxID=664642 RepID=A0A3D9MZI3_9FLAO|nr:hypothetical protein [Winogradskyella pacifica]REE25711.1 hypothetical protein DFQ09_102302 [Winogradskyella pacifica]
MTKIRYTKERLRSNSRMGIFFVAIGIILVLLSFITSEWKEISLASIGIGQIGAGIFMFLIYYFENRKQYLTLKNGELIKNTLFPKKLKLAEIKSIKEFAGDLKLITQNTEFIIDTQIVEPNSLEELKNELKNYNLK